MINHKNFEMRLKLLAIVFLSIFMGVIPISSCVDQCDGPCGCFPVFEPEAFSITQFTIEPVFRSATGRPFDPEAFYLYQILYLGIWASEYIKVNENSEKTSQSYGFFPAALANCSSGEAVSQEKLTGLKMINRQPVQITDDIFLDEGEDISNNFVATTNFQQIDDIESFTKRGHRFQEQIRFHLRFNQKPSSFVELVFDIVLELDNGKSFIFRSQRLRISP